MKPIKVAIIGLGHIGKYHIKAIQEFPELNLIAICDQKKEFSSLAPEGVDFYVDFQDLLNDDRIETVIVATPNRTHYYIAMSVLASGKHLILEKPAAESFEELVHLQNTAKESSLTIYYAFHAATAFDVEWARNWLNNKENQKKLGPITGFTCRFYDPYVENGLLKQEAEGLQNCWRDSGINALSVILRFLRNGDLDIENVSAAANGKDLPSILQCLAEFRFSVTGNDLAGYGVIDTNWTSGRNHKSTTLFFGESKHVLLMNHSKQCVWLSTPGGDHSKLADLSFKRERLYNHYLGVFKEFLSLRQMSNGLQMLNAGESVSAHELLFKTEAAINRPAGILWESNKRN